MSIRWLFLSICLAVSNTCLAHPAEEVKVNASYATGFIVGQNTGTGLFIRKYIDRNYFQVVGSYLHGYEPVSEVAFAYGRYFYQEKITAIDLPVGLHYYLSMNSQYWHDDKDSRFMNEARTSAYLYPGIGLALDLFNPGVNGVGASFSIGYGSRIEFVGDDFTLENVYLGAVFASAGLIYNW